jgi:hypothetical protein
MKRILSVLAIAAIATTTLQTSASAAPKKPYIGPKVELNGLTGFGAVGRFPISDDWSIRPSATFFSSGPVSGALITGVASYDFNLPGSPQFVPYIGLGYGFATVSGFGVTGVGSGFVAQAGVDYAVSDSIELNASGGLGGLSIGAGFKF